MNQFRNQPHMVLLIDGPFVCSLKKKILGSLRGEEEKKKKKVVLNILPSSKAGAHSAYERMIYKPLPSQNQRKILCAC